MNHRLSSTVLGLLPSAAFLIAAGLLAWSWRSELPDPIAVHFGPDGADGFGSLGGFLAMMLGIFGALAIGAWLMAILLGRSAATRRLGVGFGVGMSVFGAASTLGTLAGARGLTDPAQTPGVDGTLLVALTAGLLLGGLAAWAVPADRPDPAAGTVQGPRLDLGAQERAVWSQRVTSTVGLWIGCGTTLLMAGLSVAFRTPALLMIAALLGVLLASMMIFRVTVDGTGLHLRSALGWPRADVPGEEITAVEVTRVRAFREFGGWGVRVGRNGSVGYVLRDGEGIRVSRTGGRDLVVTVPDAATGAALLTTLAERNRAQE
jgi:hypothetical protein